MPQYLGIPSIMHYGLLFNIGNYEFDKHWFQSFDPLACPPWNPSKNHGGRSIPSGGILPPPPHPAALPLSSRPGFKRLQHLYAGATVATLNAAFCEGHRKRCPASDVIDHVCDEVDKIEAEYDEAIAKEELDILEKGTLCVDEDTRCKGWAKDGEVR